MIDCSCKRNRFRKRNGVTLVEMLVAMSILTMVGMGLLSGFVQTRRMTEGSIYLNSSTTIAQGYIEQLKNMEFSSLDENPLPTVIDQGTADPLTVSPNVVDVSVGDSATDVENVKLVDLNNTPADTSDDMRLSIVAYVENLTDESNKVGESRRISLRYTYSQNNGAGGFLHYTNVISSIRSEVPTF